MLAKLYKWLLNRRNVVGEILPGTSCAVPDCKHTASEQWFPSFCALRESGVKIEWVPVCTDHDIELNATNIQILFGDRYDAEINQYKERRLVRTE